MIKEPIIRELSDGGALVTFEGMTQEEIQLFAGIGMLSVFKDAIANFKADLDAAKLAAKANKAVRKKVKAKKPVTRKIKGKCK